MLHKEIYSLRQVANLTGLSEFTLRGWEGRYQAFAPKRTETGRRQYSKKDLKRAFLLRELTLLGFRIGDIALRSNLNLEKKLNQSSFIAGETKSESTAIIDSLLKLTVLQDWDQLKNRFSYLLSKKKPAWSIKKIILPILHELGVYAANNRLGIAQEHILSALIKEQLYIMLGKSTRIPIQKNGFSVLIATPEGDHHEIGILVAQVIFKSNGIRTLYLGTNTPKKELCETALRFGATHILLGSSIGHIDAAPVEIFSYLSYIDQHLPKSIHLWVGGPAFENSKLKLSRNFKYFSTLQQLPSSIREILRNNRGQK
jgi:MerR family transcriptional regulator, light-induced transcriptional regulator